ncbi:MAG: flavin reductase family protein [Acidobacteriota bacterium]
MEIEQYKRIMALYASGVAVVTCRTRSGEAYGVTVSSFTSVSLDPPLVLFCLSRSLTGLDDLLGGSRLAIHVLAEGQEAVSDHFATAGSDRSERCGLYAGDSGDAPHLKEYLARVEARLQRAIEAGDHVIVVCRVLEVSAGDLLGGRGPLVYWGSRYHRLAQAAVSVPPAPEAVEYWGRRETSEPEVRS